MWNTPFKNVVEVRSSSGSIIGIKISCYGRDLLIITVYRPYCGPDNVDDFMNKLEKINALCKEHRIVVHTFWAILMPVLQTILDLFIQSFVKTMDLSYLTINYFRQTVSLS